MGRRWGAVVACAALCAALSATPANAAFPGHNGKISFSRDGDVWTMQPDGSGQVQLTTAPGSDTFAAWSPDGTRIAFSSERDPSDPECDDFNLPCNGELYVMNADGSGQTRLTHTTWTRESGPAWTPDGARITFERLGGCDSSSCDYALFSMKPDGTDELPQPGGSGASEPAWSPDGKKLMVQYYDWDLPGGSLYTINPNGTGRTLFCCSPAGHNPPTSSPDWAPNGSAATFDDFNRIARQNADGSGFQVLAASPYPVLNEFPAWSPDGSKIAFWTNRNVPNGQIYLMNSDGTNQTPISTGIFPDWQPIPINAYPRPKGASPMQVSLVPAYQPCASPNRTHGPPLAFPSCAPPQRSPGQLTIGTADSNGKPTKSVSIVQIGVRPGNASTPTVDEADLRLFGTVNDVRVASDLSDYTGQLEVRMSVRITDKDNTPHPGGPGAGTVQDISYSFPIPCSATSDTTVGGDCTFETTAEAFMPGLVKELRRSIWELGSLRVYDGAGNLFMTQGIFVP